MNYDGDLQHAPLGLRCRPGAADCIADAHSAGPRQRWKVVAWKCSKTGCPSPKFSRKSSLGTPSGRQKGALSDPRGSQNRPKSLPGPILSAGRADGEKKPRAGEKVTSSFDILGRPGRSKAPFWTPGGSPKCSKIAMARLARHPGAPKWAKRLPKGGSQNGVEKVIEKGSRNESFLDA